MANIRKRTWVNKSGKHTSYEITYNVAGKQYKKGGYKACRRASRRGMSQGCYKRPRKMRYGGGG